MDDRDEVGIPLPNSLAEYATSRLSIESLDDLIGAVADVAEVRRQDGARRGAERVVGGERLGVVDIQARPGDRAAVQGSEERPALDDRPARGGGVDRAADLRAPLGRSGWRRRWGG